MYWLLKVYSAELPICNFCCVQNFSYDVFMDIKFLSLLEISGSNDAARSIDTEQDSPSIPQSGGTTAEVFDSKKGRSQGKCLIRIKFLLMISIHDQAYRS